MICFFTAFFAVFYYKFLHILKTVIIVENLKIAVLILLAVTELIILINAFKSRKPFTTLLINALSGILAIVVINITKNYSGVSIPLNWFTVLGGAAFGIPSACGYLLAAFLFI